MVLTILHVIVISLCQHHTTPHTVHVHVSLLDTRGALTHSQSAFICLHVPGLNSSVICFRDADSQMILSLLWD